MATPRKPNPQHSRTPPSSQQRPSAQQTTGPQLVDPRWILKALGIVLFVALLLAWGTLCLLYYQGQWQLVLHPSRNIATEPNEFLFPCNKGKFFDDAVGQPQLDSWFCPDRDNSAAELGMLPGFDPKFPTVLYLHGAGGNISDALRRAYELHKIHLNILLFDYRGYGRSAGQHPTQATMQQDAEAALNFLIDRQGVKPSKIILYGQGIGASLAVNLAANHHDISAIILDAPDGDLTDRVLHDAHSFLVPARLLFHEDFPLAEPLSKLTTPKLLISYTNSQHPPATLANAADPKITIELPSPNDLALIPAIQRFVDLYLHTTLPAPYSEIHLAQPIPSTYPPS